MDSIASKIEERIRSWERGRIFFINDFADLGSAEVVRQTLNRLTKAEVILRPGRGVYCYPKEYGKEMEILGLSGKYIEPTVDDIAWAIAERDHSRIAPNIAYAQYQLGLSQQIPMNVVYLTDGSGRRIPIGQRHGILFKHSSDPFACKSNSLIDSFQYQDDTALIRELVMSSPILSGFHILPTGQR